MNVKAFAAAHPVGFLKVPKILRSQMVRATVKYQAPDQIDFRPFCTPVEDQGDKPWCAAYACANWAESVLWQKTGEIRQIDPTWIYKGAKAIDGDPYGDGTTLNAVLDVIRGKMKKEFPSDVCRVKFVDKDPDEVKYAVHRYGRILGGFDITDEWYAQNPKTAIRGDSRRSIGGHAVLICGYNKDGVFIQNSWGSDWGMGGFGLVTWKAFDDQYMYGTVLTRCLDNLN